VRTGARCAAPLVALLLAGCPSPPPPPDIPPCGPDTLLTAPPLDPLDFVAVGPMGGVDPSRELAFPSHALSFFVRPVDPRLPEGEAARVPVFAPARLWIQRVRRSFFAGRPDELAIGFRTCSDVQWSLERLVNAPPDIKAMAAPPNATCGGLGAVGDETSFCEGTSAGVEVAAGTELGLAGSAINRSLDVSVRDSHAQVFFVSGRQERFVCPLDSFDAPTAGALRSMLGTPDGRRRTAEPLCGEYMQDVRATAQGNWNATADGTQVALVHDSVDPSVAIVSISTPVDSTSGSGPLVEGHVWRFTPTHSGNVNRDFREVTDDGTIYCYDASTGGDLPSIVLVQVTGEQIRYEQQDATACGAGPWTFNRTWTNLFTR